MNLTTTCLFWVMIVRPIKLTICGDLFHISAMASLLQLREYLEAGGDAQLVASLGWLMLSIAAVLVFLEYLGVEVPYGRYSNSKTFIASLLWTNFRVPAKLGWFVMEMPSFVIPLYLVLNVGGHHVGEVNPNIVLLGMFILHYFNRVFLYSLWTKGKPMPIHSVLFAFTFTSINSYMQGRYLTHYLTYDLWWFVDPRFIVGHVMFLFGMAANIHSDTVLRRLRRPGETGYKIPHGGLFDYVSGANYFSESLEWTGYAIATWSWPGFVMATFTTLFLGSRALQHHRFYLKKFENYPQHRKAFIPFLL